MREGEAFFLAQVSTLDDADFAGPSSLPDWDRAHVVAHVARNADAIGNLFAWARTGIETPMYGSADERRAGIEASSNQSVPALRQDVADASSRLLAAVDELPAEGWSAVRTARGRVIAATDVPWMRVRETWVHGIDLAAGATFADLPSPITDALIDEIASGLAGRDDCPAVVVQADDGGHWELGHEADAVVVTGDRPTIVAWLTGRGAGRALRPLSAAEALPSLPPWL